MNKPPYQKTLIGLVSLTLLSACSSKSVNELPQLKNAHKQYTYSKYARDSLNQQPVAQPSPAPQHNQSLAIIQRQLIARKQQAKQTIQQTIQRNGLFTPSQSLQQQATTLRLQAQPNLATLLTLALKNNIEIKSSLQDVKSSLAKYDQVSFLDDTLAQYAAFTKDISIPTGGRKQNKPVSNGFPFPGLLSLKGAIIDQSVESARLQLQQVVQDTITQVKLAYYQLQLGHQEITVIDKNIKLLQLLKEQLENTVSTAKINISTIYLVDIEIAKNRNKRAITQTQLDAPQARINALLNLSPQFKLAKLPPLKIQTINTPASQLLQTAKTHRVEILQLKSAIKKMAQIIRLSEKRFYPDFSAGYSRFQNQASLQTGSNATKPTFSTRPSFKKQNFFGVNDAYLNETKLKYKALQAKLNALYNKTESDIQQNLTQYKIAKNNHQLYLKQVIPLSKQTQVIAQSMFETGDSSYPEVIKSQQMILDARLLVLKSIQAMNTSTAKLERTIGKKI